MAKKELANQEPFTVANREYFLALEPNGDTLQLQYNAGNGWKDKADASYSSDDLIEIPNGRGDITWRVDGLSAGTATLFY